MLQSSSSSVVLVLIVAVVLAAIQPAHAVKIVRKEVFEGSQCNGTRVIDWAEVPSGECIIDSSTASSSFKDTCGKYQTWTSSEKCMGVPTETVDYSAQCNVEDDYNSYTYSCIDLKQPVMVTVAKGTCSGPRDELTLVLDKDVCTPMVSEYYATTATMSYRATKSSLPGSSTWTVSYWLGSTTCEGTAHTFPAASYSECKAGGASLPWWKTVLVQEIETSLLDLLKPSAGSVVAASAAGLPVALLAASAALLLAA